MNSPSSQHEKRNNDLGRHLKWGAQWLCLFPWIVYFAACTITPRPSPMSVPIPNTWQNEITSPIRNDPTLSNWWKTFQDPLLLSLIDRGIANNKEIRQASARIRETRASRVATASRFWPFLGWSTSYARNRSSSAVVSFDLADFLNKDAEENANPSSRSNGSPSRSFSFGEDRNFYATALDASWELDLFGRTRWEVAAAEARIEETQEIFRDVLLTLVAEIAHNYIELRGAQTRVSIALENITSQKESLEITVARYEAGLTSALDVEEARTLYTSTRASVPTLQTSVQEYIHRLAVLMGDPPESHFEDLGDNQGIPSAALGNSIGLPSELLRRRPDIRAAERALAATNAEIGVATGDLFPRLTLTGRLGTQGLDISDLGKPVGLSWSAGPSIIWPIFDAGRVRANIEVQNARQEQALAGYEKAILVSLEEVENAVVAYNQERLRRRWLIKSVTASKAAVEIAKERYLSGLENYLSVVITQADLHKAEDQLAQCSTATSSHVVALYKALGGGWELLE